MSKETYFVVLPFVVGKRGRLSAGEPVMAASGAHALRTAQRMQERFAGVVAFSRTGDPDAGDYDDAVILAVMGNVPGEIRGATAAEVVDAA